MLNETMQNNKRNARKRDILLIAIITILAVLSAVFISLYATLKTRATAESEKYKTSMENIYRKSYYGLVYNTDALENALTKLSVAKAKPIKQEYLSEITAYSTAAADSLTDLAENDADRSKVLKFINQTGDFAKYLDNKLSKGGSVTKEDEQTIREIGAVVREIKDSLAKIAGEVEQDGFSFLSALQREDSTFTRMVRTFENEDIDYPSMIYDGPFSDSVTEREAKALSGKEIAEEEARSFLDRILPNTEITNISVQNGSKNIFETFNFDLNTSRGKCYVTLAKKGGFPVSVSYTEQNERKLAISAEEAENAAENYARAIGFPSMKAVWVSLYENVYYVNLAYSENGVICYPDLVKVQVGGESGDILGMESLNYIFNHTKRRVTEGILPPSEAVLAVSEDLTVVNVRLAYVPTKGDKETLAYEIYGTKGSEKYFIYVSAESGEELKIMRVMDGDRGLLLS